MDQLINQNAQHFDRICQKMKKLILKKQKLKEEKIVQIVDGLFIGNYSQAIDAGAIGERGIGLVVSCVKIDEKDRVKDIVYKEMVVRDQPEERISDIFNEFITTVETHLSNNRKCLVNCFSGKSRSPTLVTAYLIHSQKINYETAFNIVKEKYPQASPNKGFVTQLKEFAEREAIKALQLGGGGTEQMKEVNQEENVQEKAVESQQPENIDVKYSQIDIEKKQQIQPIPQYPQPEKIEQEPAIPEEPPAIAQQPSEPIQILKDPENLQPNSAHQQQTQHEKYLELDQASLEKSQITARQDNIEKQHKRDDTEQIPIEKQNNQESGHREAVHAQQQGKNGEDNESQSQKNKKQQHEAGETGQGEIRKRKKKPKHKKKK